MVKGQGNSRQPGPVEILRETADELSRHMLVIRCASTVDAKQEVSAPPKGHGRLGDYFGAVVSPNQQRIRADLTSPIDAARFIPNDEGGLQIKVHLSSRTLYQASPWFPPFTIILCRLGAIVDSIEMVPLGLDQLARPLMNEIETNRVTEAATDTRVICHHNQPKAHLTQLT